MCIYFSLKFSRSRRSLVFDPAFRQPQNLGPRSGEPHLQGSEAVSPTARASALGVESISLAGGVSVCPKIWYIHQNDQLHEESVD